MANIRFVFFLFAFISSTACKLQNAPHYNQLVDMVAVRFLQSSIDNFTSQLIDLQPVVKRHDYLNYERQAFDMNSENHLLLNFIRNFSFPDMCTLVESNVSMSCCTDMNRVFTSLLLQEMWAIKIFDSYGKLPSGIFFGDAFFPGAYDECLNPETFYESPVSVPKWFNPKYCQIGIHIPKLTSLWNSKGLLIIGLCVPDTCSASDIKSLFDAGITSLSFRIGDDNNVFVCHEAQNLDLQAIIPLAVCGFIAFLLILGTFYDIITTHLSKVQKAKVTVDQRLVPGSLEMVTMNQKPNTNGSTTKLKPAKSTGEHGLLGKILVCFSVYKNASKLLNTDLTKDNLVPIHGFRFISMTWIILGHTYIFGAIVWRNNNVFVKNMMSFTFQAIGNATVSVDSFFLLSGMLVVYVGLKIMEKGNMNWLHFYVHRFWRLTPTYMLVMMVYIPLMQYWGNGPYWPQNGIEENYCRHNWWQNLLYINNLFDKQCMGWTWYLANDMQFYIISPIILILLKKKPPTGIILLLVLLICHFITTGFLWTSKKRDPRVGTSADIYMRPYTRIGPYLVGMAYGYLLHRNKCKMAINNFLSVLLWLLASACASSVLYGLYNNYNGHLMTKEVAATYMAVHRSVWAIAVGWVIYACVTGYGGFVNRLLCWKVFIPLSRLTYCAYLVHPVVIFTYFLRQRFPIYVTNFRAIHIYLGHLCVSYLVAFVVSMAFEAPWIAIEKVFKSKK